MAFGKIRSMRSMRGGKNVYQVVCVSKFFGGNCDGIYIYIYMCVCVCVCVCVM